MAAGRFPGIPTFLGSLAAAAALVAGVGVSLGQSSSTLFQATAGDGDPSAPEISTVEMKSALAAGTAVVFDARPAMEYAMGHIPGARNVAAKPGVPMSAYVSDVAEIGRALGGDKSKAIILYCNGPFCGKSRRLAAELKAAGFSNVRRYQLGMPVWRALGEPVQIEPDGLRRVLAEDRTAFVIDARDAGAFAGGSLPGARNIARSGVLDGKDVGALKNAKNDGRLPMEDHNTRVIVVAGSAADARWVAEHIAREAFSNVAFFGGTFEEALALAK
ncbi:MAG TPA: rhodanese-like domain-containing protein [Candidatus Eisenbacteria bacterium]|nr:rhodanese-like domain-containing protein [Candidatus Eisenbacteria bacterium]